MKLYALVWCSIIHFGSLASSFSHYSKNELLRSQLVNLAPPKIDLKKGLAKLWGQAKRDDTDEGTGQCLMDVATYLTGLEAEDLWAIATSDSFYKTQAGILDGAIHWLGSYDQCMKIKASGTSYNVSLDFISPGLGHAVLQHDFDMKYCRSWILVVLGENDVIIPSIGTCFPSTCSREMVSLLVAASTGYNITNTYRGEKPDLGSDAGAIIAIIILSSFGLLVIVATAVDIIRNWNSKAAIETIQENGHAHVNQAYQGNGTDPQSDAGQRIQGDTEEHQRHSTSNGNTFIIQQQKEPRKDGKAIRLLLSFSLRVNLPRVLSTAQPRGSFTCMNGVRFLSMAWIILGHTWQIGTYVLPGLMRDTVGVENYLGQFEYMGRFFHMIINNMHLAVESFFLLSGCLVTVSFLKLLNRQKGKPTCWQMTHYYLHRYLRLTPAYAMILMAYATLFVYAGSGPLYPEDIWDASGCKSTWWRNLLYLNTFPFEMAPCMGWSWYLGNDFLYYLVIPAFAFPLYLKPKIGIIVLAAGFAVTTITRIFLFIFIDTTDYSQFMGWIYAAPWSRFGSYAIGIGLGYLLYHTKCQLRISKVALGIGWTLANCLAVLAIWGTYKKDCDEDDCVTWSRAGSVAFESTYRSMFALAVAWVLFVCSCGYGGLVNTFLSWKLFVPLSRLTYIGYLIHPIIIYLYTYSRRRMIYVADFSMVMLFCGYLNLTLLAAFLLTLVFEVPFLNLEKVILPSRHK